MFSKSFPGSRLFVLAAILGSVAGVANAASVWKVSSPNGGILYLGGSIHALRSQDYPLPAAYSRAFDASTSMALEVDEKAVVEASRTISKAGEYSRNDSLKNHVDPRTYAYLRRLFGLLGIAEEKYSRYRPWYLALLLEAPSLHGRSEDLGVDKYLIGRAHARHQRANDGGMAKRRCRRCGPGISRSFSRFSVTRGAASRQSKSKLDSENRRLFAERETLLCRRRSGALGRSKRRDRAVESPRFHR